MFALLEIDHRKCFSFDVTNQTVSRFKLPAIYIFALNKRGLD